MDTDFHYFGTGSAARSAGFTPADASLIANAAEYVDFFNSDYWSNWKIVDTNDTDLFSIKVPQLSCQSIDWKMIRDYDADLWNAFHFPPGNLAHKRTVYNDGWERRFQNHFEARETKLGATGAKLCRPYSEFALAMAEDTMLKYNSLINATGDTLKQRIAEYLHPRARFPVSSGRHLALILLGIRMHVLADTWAHQDFTGEANKHINGAGTLNYIYATKKEKAVMQNTQWTGTLWVLGSDTDCAAAPDFPGDAACRGHGQVGHYPDYSWLSFIYPAAWLPNGVYLLRENPPQYIEAWKWLKQVMQLCRNGTGTADLLDIPAEIENAIRHKQELDCSKLSAVYKSEDVWRVTQLGGQLDLSTRWNNSKGTFNKAQRVNLGVQGGTLPTTRLGTVRIVQDSTLHYMELASAIHYQWAVNWSKANTEYKWSPKDPS